MIRRWYRIAVTSVKPLREVVSRLPQGIYEAAETANSRSVDGAEVILAPEHVKENAFTLHDGTLAVRTGNALTPVLNLPDETARRIKGLIKVRDAVREFSGHNCKARATRRFARARRELNLRYELIFGAIWTGQRHREPALPSGVDPDYPLLCSLEDYNDETKRAEKTAIFRERTIRRPRRPRLQKTQKMLLFSSLMNLGGRLAANGKASQSVSR